MADPLKKEREATIKALKTIIEDNQKILEANQAGTEEFKKAAAENKKANAERKSLEKQQITLGKDLTKNFQDIGTTITGGAHLLDVFERKGNEYVNFDVLLQDDFEDHVAMLRHWTIFKM